MASDHRNERQHVLDVLLKVAREIGPPVPLDALLRRIDSATRTALDCERVTVFLIDRSTDELYSRLATGETEIRIPADKGIAGRTFQEARILNVPDVFAEPAFYPAVDRRTGFRTKSLLSIPLVGFDSSVVGVLQVVNKKGRPFNETDEEMADALASLTGVALQRQLLLDEYVENRRREQELGRARQIQRSLLPDSDPTLAGYDIAGWSQAAHETGGDFYDYLTLPDGRACIVVADVAGHGFESALIACETRALFRGLAAHLSDLDMIVSRTNKILCSDLRYERFVTMFAVGLDEFESKLQYVSAGCVPLLYLSSTDSSHQLPATTLPLAVLDTFQGPVTAEIHINPGDIFTLVTDGFYECENAQEEQFGIARICAVMRDNRGQPASELIRQLHLAIGDFAVGAPKDDLTVVVIKRLEH